MNGSVHWAGGATIVEIDSTGLTVPGSLDPGGEVGSLTLIANALREVVLGVFKDHFTR
jgi:hypothetical protein